MKTLYAESIYIPGIMYPVITIVAKHSKKEQFSMILVKTETSPVRENATDEITKTFDAEKFLEEVKEVENIYFHDIHRKFNVIRIAVEMADIAKKNAPRFLREATEDEKEEYFCS